MLDNSTFQQEVFKFSNPRDPNILLVCGYGIVRSLRLSNGQGSGKGPTSNNAE